MWIRHRPGKIGAGCLLALGLWAWFLPGSGFAQPVDPLRVASTSLCADQYLLMLADREQIASLSWQSRSDLSYFAERAEGIAQNRGTAEELLVSETEVVVMDQASDPRLKRLLQRFGMRVVELPFNTEIAEVEVTVETLAEAIGQTERGRRLARDLRERRAVLEDARPVHEPLAAYYRRDGGGAGAGTYVDSVLNLAGFRNLQSELGGSGYDSLPLEQVVTNPPEIFVTSFFDEAKEMVSMTFANNPLVWRLFEERPVVSIPGSLWVCASPLLLDAAERLRVERERHFGSDRGLAETGALRR